MILEWSLEHKATRHVALIGKCMESGPIEFIVEPRSNLVKTNDASSASLDGLPRCQKILVATVKNKR